MEVDQLGAKVYRDEDEWASGDMRILCVPLCMCIHNINHRSECGVVWPATTVPRSARVEGAEKGKEYTVSLDHPFPSPPGATWDGRSRPD